MYRAAELDILVTDLERANQRAAAAEKETERLQHLGSEKQSTTEHDKVHTYMYIGGEQRSYKDTPLH